LKALLPLLTRNENRKFLENAQSAMKDWWRVEEDRAYCF